MYVEGHLLDKHLAVSPGTYSTSRICRVLEPCRLEGSSGREYILEGALVPRETEVDGFVGIALTPQFVLDRFSHGFPPNWATLKDNWALYVGRQLEAQQQARDGTLLASETVGRVPLSPLYLLATPRRSSSSPSVLQMVKLRTSKTTVVMKQGKEQVKAFREQGLNQEHSDGRMVPSIEKQNTNQESIESKEKSIKTLTKLEGIGEKTKIPAEKVVVAGSMVITRETGEKKKIKSNILEAIMTGGNIVKKNKSVTTVRKSARMTLKVIPQTPEARKRKEDQNFLNTTAKSSPARKRTHNSMFWHAEYPGVKRKLSREEEVSSQQAKEKIIIPTKVIPKSSKTGSKKNGKYESSIRKPSTTGEDINSSSEIRETQSSSNTTARSPPRKRTKNSPFWHAEYKRIEAEMSKENRKNEAGSSNRKPSITVENIGKTSEIRETQEGQSSSNAIARSFPRKRTQNGPFWHAEYKRVDAEMAKEQEMLSKKAKKVKNV